MRVYGEKHRVARLVVFERFRDVLRCCLECGRAAAKCDGQFAGGVRFPMCARFYGEGGPTALRISGGDGGRVGVGVGASASLPAGFQKAACVWGVSSLPSGVRSTDGVNAECAPAASWLELPSTTNTARARSCKPLYKLLFTVVRYGVRCGSNDAIA